MGIKIYTGDDRVRISELVKNELSNDYEVFEGETLNCSDLPGIFFGTTLFANTRKILIKDLAASKEVFEDFCAKFSDYSKTDAEVIIWESKLDKRLASTKSLVKAGAKISEFNEAKNVDSRAILGIYDLALRDGEAAVRELEKIESEQDPYMFLGLMASQALRRLSSRPNGSREKKILKEIADVDMQMKSTAFEPWILIKSLILRITSLR